MTSLHLVGTIHNDLKGPERLETVLNYLKPDILAVEGCEELIQETRGNNQSSPFLHILGLKGYREQAYLLHQFSVLVSAVSCYELRVCKAFAKKQERTIVYLDTMATLEKSETQYADYSSNILSQLPVKGFSKNKSIPSVLDELIKDSDPANVDTFYDLANNLFINPDASLIDALSSNVKGHILGDRDAIFEQKIRQLTNQPDKRIVVVMGAGHLFNDPQQQTLYERIKDLQPERLLLKQYAERIAEEKI